MADEDQPKKRSFWKFSYRGIDLDKLLDMSNQDLMELFRARQRRKFSRGIKRAPITLLKKLRKAKRETAYGEKPEAVKTHLRYMVNVPEMIGGVVGVCSGKQFINVEIKPETPRTGARRSSARTRPRVMLLLLLLLLLLRISRHATHTICTVSSSHPTAQALGELVSYQPLRDMGVGWPDVN